MDRPALKRLLADIDTGKIDCVVVYKVDRLSRSLLDFAKIMEVFEQRKVSFVSVSACQTASLDAEGDPMASVAGRLTGTGIPAILAMTHSVLVATTRTLFWNAYDILADIADQQSQLARAAEYRRLAREAKRNFAGTAHEMKRHLPVIIGTWQAIHDPDTADEFRAALSQMAQRGWTNLVAAIRQILAGERSPETLCGPLDFEDSMIIETILQAIADPAMLSALLPVQSRN